MIRALPGNGQRGFFSQDVRRLTCRKDCARRIFTRWSLSLFLIVACLPLRHQFNVNVSPHDLEDTYPSLVDAVHQHLVSEAYIDTALRRLFTARFRLGMFDPPSSYAYRHIPFSEDNSPAHRALYTEAGSWNRILHSIDTPA